MEPLVEDPLVGQTVGGYVVEYALGEGAMGLVYRVRHPLLNRHFAIKVLRPEVAADATSSSNFTREAQTLSKLKHPAIVDIVGFGPMADGRQFMVMEYLVGRTLERELLEEGRLEPARALQLSDEILDGLSAAHSVDVIHRDLKPSNVFLAKMSGGREVVKLLDFGLARQQPAPLAGKPGVDASESGIAGTPEYIAPEQATGLTASKQSDLYSFGVMLFRMLTGTLPFKVDSDLPESAQILSLMTKHVRQAPPSIQEAASDAHFPEGLSELVTDLLRKNPADRPSSADTVRKRLRRVFHNLDQQTTHLTPNPLPPEPAALAPNPRPKRRRSLLVGGVTALLVALLAGWLGSRSISPGPALAASKLSPAAPANEPTPTPLPVPQPSAPVLSPSPPASPEPEEPLMNLPLLTEKRTIRPRPVLTAVAPVPTAAPCSPDAEWKKRARADLNELATRASTSTVELTLWAADRERPLSAAIDAAASDTECRAVGVALATFKQKVTGR